MSLRYIVPSLGILACTAGPAMAADAGGLTINGYVDTILEINSMDENLNGVKGGTIAVIDGDEASDLVIDFSAAAQLEVGYAIGDVMANVELYFEDDDTLTVEQAYANWKINDSVSIKMGKFHNGIGLEGYDAPELYRVNNSALFNGVGLGVDVDGDGFATEDDVIGILGVDDKGITGVRVGFTGPEGDVSFSGGITLCDGVYDPMVAKDNDELAILLDASVVVADLGTFEGDLVYDMGAGMDDATGEHDDIFAIDLSGTIDVLKEKGLIFGYELNYTDGGELSAMGILAMANYKFTTDVPMSATLMLDYITVDSETADESGSEMEIAVALLTNPTKEENFGLNVEVRYIDRDYEDLAAVEDVSEFGIYLEMLAVIP